MKSTLDTLRFVKVWSSCAQLDEFRLHLDHLNTPVKPSISVFSSVWSQLQHVGSFVVVYWKIYCMLKVSKNDLFLYMKWCWGLGWDNLFNKKNLLWDRQGMKPILHWTGFSQASFRMSALLGVQPWNPFVHPLIIVPTSPVNFHDILEDGITPMRITVLTRLPHFTDEWIPFLKKEELLPNSHRDLEINHELQSPDSLV